MTQRCWHAGHTLLRQHAQDLGTSQAVARGDRAWRGGATSAVAMRGLYPQGRMRDTAARHSACPSQRLAGHGQHEARRRREGHCAGVGRRELCSDSGAGGTN